MAKEKENVEKEAPIFHVDDFSRNIEDPILRVMFKHYMKKKGLDSDTEEGFYEKLEAFKVLPITEL